MLLKICCETLLADAVKLKSQSKASTVFLPVINQLIHTPGLVILEANYGSAEESESASDLNLDVTIPLQALTRNSQLFISKGEEAKVTRAW